MLFFDVFASGGTMRGTASGQNGRNVPNALQGPQPFNKKGARVEALRNTPGTRTKDYNQAFRDASGSKPVDKRVNAGSTLDAFRNAGGGRTIRGSRQRNPRGANAISRNNTGGRS